ncbi:hypothetical protein [Paenibacillus hexagrammi]|uniref:Acyltransferase 3 domain-containing protein n=1 Tax=Paenibacillus hexagrammi TaxID=2908839 RepID=A0ABY3SER2_9BACL|nr:hypothetical protein [Paenibacillus sp. YPD9-1]UJF32483.1 hypothetical protein L0M14_22835 [Paenibacillus sp. YPD9-1]
MPVMIFNSRSYHIGWFSDPSRDTNAFGGFYYLCISLFMVVLIMLPWKQTWLKMLLVVGTIYIIKSFLANVGILHSYVWWDYPYYILIHVIVFMLCAKMSRQLNLGLT